MKLITYLSYEQRIEFLRGRMPPAALAAEHPLNATIVNRLEALWRRKIWIRVAGAFLLLFSIAGFVGFMVMADQGLPLLPVLLLYIAAATLPMYVLIRYFLRRKSFERLYDAEQVDLLSDLDLWLAGYDFRYLAGLQALLCVNFRAHGILRYWLPLLCAIASGLVGWGVMLSLDPRSFLLTLPLYPLGALVGLAISHLKAPEVQVLFGVMRTGKPNLLRRRRDRFARKKRYSGGKSLDMDDYFGVRTWVGLLLGGYFVGALWIFVFGCALTGATLSNRNAYLAIALAVGLATADCLFFWAEVALRRNFAKIWNALITHGLEKQAIGIRERNDGQVNLPWWKRSIF